MSAVPIAAPALHPLVDQLFTRHGFVRVDAESRSMRSPPRPGHALLVFTEDPVRYKETLDLAVIAPEVASAFAGRFRVAVLLPADARKVAPRYGFARWPALVVLKDGHYVGAIDGLRNWHEYIEETQRLLDAEPTRAPSIGIAVKTAGDRRVTVTEATMTNEILSDPRPRDGPRLACRGRGTAVPRHAARHAAPSRCRACRRPRTPRRSPSRATRWRACWR